MDGQRADRRRRLLVPVAADGQPARCRRSRRLRPDHRRAVGRGRQDRGGDVLAALSAWRELFNDILPAHIVKDVPGGFAAGLARALPVTGGQFRVENIDPQRDEILLARNDRYWSVPAKPDQMLFRRGGSDRRAGRFDSQRRHAGRSGARRRGGVRATVRDSRRADRAHRHAAGHAADAAGTATHTRGFPSAQSDSGPDGRRPARVGRRRRRQHRHPRAGTGALPVRPRLRADRAAGDDARRRRSPCWPMRATRSSPVRGAALRRRRAYPRRRTTAAASPRTATR